VNGDLRVRAGPLATVGRMRLRATLVCGLIAAATTAPVAQAAAPATPAAPTPAAPVIGQGISAGGVDLSGLTVTAAAAKLTKDATAHAMRVLALNVAGKHFHLTMAQADLRFDARATAKAALAAPPAPPSQGGGAAAGTVVSLVLSHSDVAVAAFVARVAAQVTVAPQNATLSIQLRHMEVTRAHAGHTIDQPRTAHLIDTTLDDGDAGRDLHVAVLQQRAQVNTNDLAHANATIVTVDRANFVLRLFKHLKVVQRYPIAVGMAGLETPTGLYHVQDKQVNPSWHVPNSPWAGALAGQVIPPGPADPIVARWMGLADGVGIHGTNEPWTVGSAASHGCIRMRVPDVIALYGRVPVGTPVLIH
jgi:lipoprotein-anchoring transpeptidase ErfK/SrfK